MYILYLYIRLNVDLEMIVKIGGGDKGFGFFLVVGL